MSVKFMRKTAVAVAATALLGGGLAVGVGQGVAGAEGSTGSSDVGGSEECKASISEVKSGFGTAKYRATNAVADASEATPGGTVTIRTTVAKERGAVGAVDWIGQHYPESYKVESAVIYQGLNRDKVKDNSGKITSDADGYVRMGGFGLAGTLDGGKTAIAEITYRIPKDASAGDLARFGYDFHIAGGNAHAGAESGPCVKLRDNNPVEAAFGSLDDLGLGSVEGGVNGVTGSVTNPSGSIADVINQVDMGKIIGGIIGGAVGS